MGILIILCAARAEVSSLLDFRQAVQPLQSLLGLYHPKPSSHWVWFNYSNYFGLEAGLYRFCTSVMAGRHEGNRKAAISGLSKSGSSDRRSTIPPPPPL